MESPRCKQAQRVVADGLRDQSLLLHQKNEGRQAGMRSAGNISVARQLAPAGGFRLCIRHHITRRNLTFHQLGGYGASDQWVEHGSATRRILFVGWIDLHLMRIFWSPTVHNFSRPQFQMVQSQFVAEVLRWLHPNFEMEERAADGTHDNEWHIVNG